jgi:asparagine synthase (glutamine-hydrolysing)
MPGIAGFFQGGNAHEGARTLERMMVCMNHAPSYASQVLKTDAAVHAGCVCRPAAQRSAWNDRGDVGIFLFGEPQTDQDALRLLLMLYEKEGLQVLARLNGWFSGLFFDYRTHETTLFNDRYGLGRVYFNQSAPGFFFSSEAKSLLQIFPETRSLDESGLAEWFSCGCVLQNRTLFSGISLLPAGSAWTFSAEGRLARKSYFNPSSWETQPLLSADEYDARLKEIFPRVLGYYLNGDEPVAMSLTGGLDGRMIMSWAGRAGKALPCYTFNGPVRDCADVKIARKVAKVCGQTHQTIPLESNFFAEFPALAAQSVYITDGAMDVTGAAELYMNRRAGRIAPVRLTGNYGSEILRRYVAFRPRQFQSEMFAPDFVPKLAEAANTYAGETDGNRLSFIAFKQVPWHHYARFAIEQSQLTLRSPFLDNELVALAFQAPPAVAMSLSSSLRLIAEGNPALGRIPTDRGITYPADRLANRLHRSVQEFLARAEYAYDYGMPQWLAKLDHVLSPLHLEKLFLGRQKFYHFRIWYRDALSQYVKDVLLDPRTLSRPYLNGRKVEKMVNAHVRGAGNYTLEIHKLLTSEIIQRQLIEKV